MKKKNSRKPFFLFNLPNGLKAVFWPLKGIEAVAIYLWIKAGSWHENEIKNGTFHFLEHVLAHGTKNYPSFTKLSLKEEDLGVSASHRVGGANSKFSWRVPKGTFIEALQLLSECVFSPVFPNDGIEGERKIILQEYLDHWDSPDNRFFFHLLESYWGRNHPYTLDPRGVKDVIKDITREDLVFAHQKYYCPEKMILVVVGDLSVNLVEEKVKAYFHQPKGEENSEVTFNLPKFSRKIFFQEEKIKQVAFTGWFPLFKLRADDWQKRYIVAMISHLLGSSRRSRLAISLREREPLAYSAGSTFITFPEGAVFRIGFSSSLENTTRIIEIIKEEIEKIKKEGFTPEEFLSSQKYCMYQISMSNDSVWAIAENLVDDLFWRKKIYLPDDLQTEVRKITNNDLTKAVREIFNFDKATIGFMCSPENIKSLRKFGIEKMF
ncbi:insulinase family protein [Patescibacteria group bacterium]|nr:insulinase family protein [Patescibacteria group bacterium]